MPLNGLQGSGLAALRGFATVRDPYSGQDVVTVPAIAPDLALIHVQEADAEGNGRIWGSVFEDTLMVRAARRVVLTAERLVDGASFAAEPDRTDVPGFLVEAVVEVPGGAWPTSCAGLYPYDEALLAGFVEVAADPAALRRYVDDILGTDPAAAVRRLAGASSSDPGLHAEAAVVGASASGRHSMPSAAGGGAGSRSGDREAR
jgi:glutaconate CoA-transferase subunit A